MKLSLSSLLCGACLSILMVLTTSCDNNNTHEPSLNDIDGTKSKSVSYCSSNVGTGLGVGQEAELGGCVMMSSDMLTNVGSFITAVRVAVLSEATNCEMFISNGIDEAPIVTKSFTPMVGTWSYIALDEPLKIEANKEYYIGYKATGSGYLLGVEQTSKAPTAEYVYLNGTWKNLADEKMKYHMSIQAMMIGGDYSNIRPQTDLEMATLSCPRYIKINTAEELTCRIINNGVNEVSSFEISYSYAGESQTVTINDAHLMSGACYEYTLPIRMSASTAQSTSLTVSVSASNDEQSKNNSLTKSQLIYERSYPRTILLEQFTSQSCPNCPSGSTAIAKVMENYTGRYVHITHHVGYKDDNFTIEASKPLTQLYNSNSTFAPAIDIDRTYLDDLNADGPVFSVGYLTTNVVDEMLSAPSLATVNINRTYNEETRALSITVSGNVLTGLANPQITVYLIQNNIVATQSNGGNDYNHMHTVRACLTSDWGDALTINSDNSYTATYTYTIPATVGSFTCVPADMSVVAFVTDHGSSVLNREVHNVNEVSVVENSAPADLNNANNGILLTPVLKSINEGCYTNR